MSRKKNILYTLLLAVILYGCHFNKRFPPNETSGIGLFRTHKDSIVIILVDSFDGITKYSCKESGDTLYIDNIYTGLNYVNTSIYVSPSIKYVYFQGYTQEIDSIKKPRE